MMFEEEETKTMKEKFKEEVGREITKQELLDLERYILCDVWDWLRINIKSFIRNNVKY